MPQNHNYEINDELDKQEAGEIYPTNFEDIGNWSKRVHKLIFEETGGNHVIHLEIRSGGITRKLFWSMNCGIGDNEFSWEFLQSFPWSSADKDIIPEFG